MRDGAWETDGAAPLTRSADNQTVGILGLGRIGQAIADKLAAFNSTILYHTRTKKDVDYTYYDNLTAMAHDADVLICITPGGPSTHNIVNAEVLEALGPNGTLINVSRGSVVDETALIQALQTGKLGWAGLDVFCSGTQSAPSVARPPAHGAFAPRGQRHGGNTRGHGQSDSRQSVAALEGWHGDLARAGMCRHVTQRYKAVCEGANSALTRIKICPKRFNPCPSGPQPQ